MALTIVTGAAGSGKTESIFQNLISSSREEPGKKYIIIAPEQATLQIEKRIIAMHPGHVLFNIDVLSFNRLAYRIFDECEMPSPVIIDENGKSMLLRSILKEYSKDLTIYKKSAEKNGFTKKLKTIISELLMYGITPDDLRNSADLKNKMGDNLRDKLNDLAIILDAFISSHDKHNITAEELLPKALNLLSQCNIFKDCFIVFEGFSGFTPIQYKYIGEMIKTASEVVVSLTIPGDENPSSKPEMGQLFALTKRTYIQLIDTASKAGKKTFTVSQGDESLVPKSRALSYLSQKIFRNNETKFPLEETSSIKIYNCLNPKQELELVVHEIHRLVREEGFRYRDFAVVSDNISNIDYVIKEVFSKANIPCYIDTKSDALSNPLAVLSLAALEAGEKSFTMESVMRYLRSGLLPITAEEIDELENYALAIGVRSIGKWKETWDKTPHKWQGEINFERLNDIKFRALSGLFDFKEAYQKAKKVSERSRALKNLLESLKLSERLSDLSDRFAENGDEIKAQEYRQIYDKLIHILDEYEKLLGDCQIKKDEFRSVLSSGLEDLKLGHLPATLDEVHIGDVRRSRRGYIKTLFFIDFNEGIIPTSQAGGGILCDSDRDQLAELGVELAPSALQNILDEKIYVYELLSAPTKHLYIINSRMDMSNKPLKPSVYLTDILGLFEGLKVDTPKFGHENIELGFEGLDLLVKGLRETENEADNKKLLQLVSSLKKNGFSENTSKIISGSLSEYEGSNLSKEAILSLYGKTYFGSVSRLELQAKCAYAHFLKYGLNIREREEHEFTKMDLGNFSHKVFQTMFDEIRKQGLNVKNVSQKDRDSIISHAILLAEDSIHATDYTNGEGTGENQYRLDRAKRIAIKVSNVLLDMVSDSDDYPAHNEYEFTTEPFKLSEGNSLVLNGKIDRYDISNDSDPKVKVYDYKSSDKKLEDKYIEAGISLQLLEYLNIAVEKEQRTNKNTKAEGAFYIISEDKMLSVNSPFFDGGENLVSEYRPKGMSNSEKDPTRLNKMQEVTKRKIIENAEEIMKGDISVKPYDKKVSCDFCPYKDACGFDKNIPGYEYKGDLNKEVTDAEINN